MVSELNESVLQNVIVNKRVDGVCSTGTLWNARKGRIRALPLGPSLDNRETVLERENGDAVLTTKPMKQKFRHRFRDVSGESGPDGQEELSEQNPEEVSQSGMAI